MKARTAYALAAMAIIPISTWALSDSNDGYPKNKDPMAPWNDPIHRNDPFAPHNDPISRRDPFKPWNSPVGRENDLTPKERKEYGLGPSYEDRRRAEEARRAEQERVESERRRAAEEKRRQERMKP